MNNKLALIIFIFIASCSPRNLVYMSDIDAQAGYSETISNTPEPRIQADDLLSISVTSLSPEANMPFNAGSEANKEGYLVDKNGTIDYPVLGRVKLGGLTKTEAIEKLNADLRRYLKEPIVRIRYLNYKITVVGEVNNPSTFTIPSEKINIIEALGMAGDMTVFGKRENIMIIREEEGVRKVVRLNLNSKDLLNSPYFYLRQNDMVYVEPVKVKGAQASAFRTNLPIILSLLSLVSIISYRFVR
jgi:polysaccharide export outer membrane protein